MEAYPALRLDCGKMEELRASRNWSHTMLAAQLGLSENQLKNLLKGKNSPSGRVVARLSILSGQAVPLCKVEEASA